MTRKKARILVMLFTVVCLLSVACLMLSIPTYATAESTKFLSIRQLRQTTPASFEISTETRKGDVTITAPIIIPEKEQLPVLDVQYIDWRGRISCPPNMQIESQENHFASLDSGFTAWYPEINPLTECAYSTPMEGMYAENNAFSKGDARQAYIEAMSQILGLNVDVDFKLDMDGVIPYSCYTLYTEENGTPLKQLTDKGYYEISATDICQVLHGSALNNIQESICFYRQEKYAPFIPAPSMSAFLVDNNCMCFSCMDLVEETACLAEDIPLLPWKKILETIQKHIAAGRITAIRKVELRELVLLNTPELDKDVFRAMPCWIIVGDFPDPRIEYQSNVTHIAYVNAQTGTFIDPFNASADRGAANPLITWESLKK